MGIQERKEREKEQRRESIIDAAEQVFFSKGFTVATMDDIADVAELSKGTLYLYFKSKEDLLLAVHLRGEEIMYRMFLEATGSGESTLVRIINLGNAYYRFFLQYPDYFRSFNFLENPQFHKQASAEMMQECQEHGQLIWDLVFNLLKEGVEENLFVEGLDPIQASIMLWSGGNALMRQMDTAGGYWEKNMDIDLEDTLRKMYRYLMQGMLRDDVRLRSNEILDRIIPPRAIDSRSENL